MFIGLFIDCVNYIRTIDRVHSVKAGVLHFILRKKEGKRFTVSASSEPDEEESCRLTRSQGRFA